MLLTLQIRRAVPASNMKQEAYHKRTVDRGESDLWKKTITKHCKYPCCVPLKALKPSETWA